MVVWQNLHQHMEDHLAKNLAWLDHVARFPLGVGDTLGQGLPVPEGHVRIHPSQKVLFADDYDIIETEIGGQPVLLIKGELQQEEQPLYWTVDSQRL